MYRTSSPPEREPARDAAEDPIWDERPALAGLTLLWFASFIRAIVPCALGQELNAEASLAMAVACFLPFPIVDSFLTIRRQRRRPND